MHLSFCDVCRENRAMQQEEKTAWQRLLNRMSEKIIKPADGTEKQEGQVWIVKKSLGGWQNDGRYFQAPAVLLLGKSGVTSSWKVAQLYDDKRLIGDGDVLLDDRFGFAEAWNCYEVEQGALDRFIGCVKQDELHQVVAASEAEVAEPLDGSVLLLFRSLESEVGSYMATQAIQLTVESQAEEPFRFDCLIRKMSGWFQELMSPAPLAVAVAIVAVITLAVFKSVDVQQTQVALVPHILPAPNPHPVPGKQASPEQQAPLSKSESFESIPGPNAAEPTVTASIQAVSGSRGLTKVSTATQSMYGFSANQQPDKAAYRLGIALIDLSAARKMNDSESSEDAVNRINDLLPIFINQENQQKTVQGSVGMTTKEYNRLVADIENQVAKSGQNISLRFGAWLQSARRVDDLQLAKIVTPETVKRFSKDLVPHSLLPSHVSAFDGLATHAASKSMDIKEVRRLLDEIFYTL